MDSGVHYHIKENSWVAKIAAFKLGSSQVAIVLGNTIHLHNTTRKAFLDNPKWLKHELCHIAQFQRYGFTGFICRYLWESIRMGYYNNKYEVEAREAEQL